MYGRPKGIEYFVYLLKSKELENFADEETATH